MQSSDDIGHRIRSAREARRLTIEKLASKTNMTAKRLSQIECGKAQAKLNEMIKLAMVLDINAFVMAKEVKMLDYKEENSDLVESLWQEHWQEGSIIVFRNDS